MPFSAGAAVLHGAVCEVEVCDEVEVPPISLSPS
jgi:hypothetical protein